MLASLLLAWNFIKKYKTWFLYGLGVLVLLIAFGIIWHSCSKKQSATIDLETIQKVNSKDKAEIEAGVNKAVTENADVIKTVDNRTAITELSIEERDKALQEKINAVKEEVAKAKEQGKDITGAELDCMLTGVNCEQ